MHTLIIHIYIFVILMQTLNISLGKLSVNGGQKRCIWFNKTIRKKTKMEEKRRTGPHNYKLVPEQNLISVSDFSNDNLRCFHLLLALSLCVCFFLFVKHCTSMFTKYNVWQSNLFCKLYQFNFFVNI